MFALKPIIKAGKHTMNSLELSNRPIDAVHYSLSFAMVYFFPILTCSCTVWPRLGLGQDSQTTAFEVFEGTTSRTEALNNYNFSNFDNISGLPGREVI